MKHFIFNGSIGCGYDDDFEDNLVKSMNDKTQKLILFVLFKVTKFHLELWI